MQADAHVLVVANRTAESDELLAALEQRAAGGGTRFTLVVPATPHGVAWAADMHSGGEEAQAHVDAAIDRLRAAGLDITAMIGDPDPIAAVEDALNLEGPFDGVIVATLPSHVSKWLKMDLPHRVERKTGLTVTHVIGSESKAVV